MKICLRHEGEWKDGHYICKKCGKGLKLSKKELNKRLSKPHHKAE